MKELNAILSYSVEYMCAKVMRNDYYCRTQSSVKLSTVNDTFGDCDN